MSEKKDLRVTITIPNDNSDVRISVSSEDNQSITEGEVVYYLFQTATTVLSYMSETEREKTIGLIGEFFE